MLKIFKRVQFTDTMNVELMKVASPPPSVF